MPDLSLFTKLQSLRDEVGFITITSGYRTEKFNKSVGGHPKSFHLEGSAVDIRFNFKGWTRQKIEQLTYRLGFTNVGFYYVKGKLNRLHLDIGKPWSGNFYTFTKEV